MANLILDYYKGEDVYTDGEIIENKILKIVKDNKVKEVLNDTESDFATIYHLTPVRENILNWYPFNNNDTILEVGAGMGAITGALCKKCKMVSSVDLSLKRSQVNYERHKDLKNLNIYVGNMNDITFNEKFDYVVLNGVFEYAELFTDSENAALDFLKNFHNYLKPNGRILISIENRLGLKYFSGAPEDHTGNYFEGINNYGNLSKTVRTYSHSELSKMLDKAGYESKKFFYPYPDYKFPQEVYTDISLDTYIKDKKFNKLYQGDINLFDEQILRNTLADEGVLKSFSNSFLVDASASGLSEAENITYVKANTDREIDKQIITILYDDKAVKMAATKEAEKHIVALKENEKKLKKVGLNAINGKLIKDSIEYPFIKYNSLEQTIREHILKNEYKEIQTLIEKFYSNIKSKNVAVNKIFTDKFEKYFGNLKLEDIDKCLCVKPANIDAIVDNIFINDDEFYLLDCEWVADFYVPLKFIKWYTVHDIYVKFPLLNNHLSQTKWYEELNINDSDVQIFKNWIIHFSKEYVKHNTLQMHNKGIIDVNINDIVRHKNICSTLYYSHDDTGFSEEKTIKEHLVIKDRKFEIEFANIVNVDKLRFDPLENEICICKINSIADDKGNFLSFSAMNAVKAKFNNSDTVGDLFLNIDPIYNINIAQNSNIKSLTIKGEIEVKTAQEICMYFNNK